MSGSSSVVNYNTRPCKSAERKMICEMISALEYISPVSDYRYIGMGARYFADFALIHKLFGISDMVSIEIESREKERFIFNKPFNCIDLRFQSSTQLLESSEFPWRNRKNIIWLDYDGGFRKEQIRDIELCIEKVHSISLVFITSNISLGDEYDAGTPLEKQRIFCERVKNQELTRHFSKENFRGDGIYKCVQNVFSLCIEKTKNRRNSNISDSNKEIHVEQIAYFKYQDSSAPMITLGWIVYPGFFKEQVEKSRLKRLPFYSAEDKPYDIAPPNLTYKEMAILNQNMPKCEYPIAEAPFIPQEEVEAYKRLYRYYPTTIETNLVL